MKHIYYIYYISVWYISNIFWGGFRPSVRSIPPYQFFTPIVLPSPFFKRPQNYSEIKGKHINIYKYISYMLVIYYIYVWYILKIFGVDFCSSAPFLQPHQSTFWGFRRPPRPTRLTFYSFFHSNRSSYISTTYVQLVYGVCRIFLGGEFHVDSSEHDWVDLGGSISSKKARFQKCQGYLKSTQSPETFSNS